MKICIVGASGMLGHMLFTELLHRGFEVCGITRSLRPSSPAHCERVLSGVDVLDMTALRTALDILKPTVVINAVGLIRQLPEGRLPLPCIEINAAFPHRLWNLARQRGIRCIHYSTDCVFDGKAGRPYTEQDPPTATDVYGLSKYMGELSEDGALTLRTSIIGPELRGKLSLVEWFLAQKGTVRGYTRALYTGLPTSEQARILAEFVLPTPQLEGLFQVTAAPISKYDLLCQLADVYSKSITIEPYGDVHEDKRLAGDAFQQRTGYVAPPWPDMLKAMREAQERAAALWLPLA